MPRPERGKAAGFEIKPWIAIAVIALIVAGFAFWIYSYRHRWVRTGPDLISLLPPATATIFYADLEAMRRAHVIGVLHQVKFADESAYSAFVQQTGFDYTRDVDQLAGEVRGSQDLYFVGRGRFDWDRLRKYARDHGGRCDGTFCQAPTTTAGRWASFTLIQSDVIALVVSRTATRFQPRRRSGSGARWPIAPLWVQLSPDLLASSSPTRIPLPALWGATNATISAEPALNASQAGFILRLEASYPNAQTAAIACTQLAIQTKTLNFQFQRSGIAASSSDIAGVLTSGSFRVAGDHVIGTWKVSQSLLKSLE